MISIRETNEKFDSCKWLGTSRLHELHGSKFSFVSRKEFICYKLQSFSAYVSGDREEGGREEGLSDGVWVSASGIRVNL